MRKPKRWIIGLLVVFLTLCVGMWRSSVGVPYAFLEGRPRVYAEVDSGGSYREYYAFKGPHQKVADLISKGVPPNVRRVPGDRWVAPDVGDDRVVSLYWYMTEFDDLFRGDRLASVPKGTQAVVAVSRTASPLDRLTAWLYRLRFDGPPARISVL